MKKTILVSTIFFVSISLFVSHLHVSGQNMENPEHDNYEETGNHTDYTIHSNFTESGKVIVNPDKQGCIDC